ncbi:MAG: DUF366 family protein [Candidatus Heimdallarchaeota archaeon]|nr:DUF366 family protein [Candidatus Heimdallarchaeota archaeon]
MTLIGHPIINWVGSTIEIKLIDFSNRESYTGKQIHPLWALDNLGIAGDSFVIFRGSMNISREEMIDVRDIVRERTMADILIAGDDCLHFIIEMFDDQPANLKIAYHRLHLLAFIVQRFLEQELQIALEKKGTDLYYQGQKINVAIATCSNNSAKIHFGLNVVSTGVPAHVKAIGLKEINRDIVLENLALTIAKTFITELEAIKDDLTKSRTF